MKHLTDPFAQLMQEHTSVLLQLKQLQKTARAIRQDGYSTKYSRQFHFALRFIEEEVRIHNHREENALFPVLERYVEGPTRLMRDDHKKLNRWFIALGKTVEEVERRRDSFSAIRKLSDVA
jgi:hemerythrin-like domain-containing protein